jgi:hypothetical protein
VDCEGTPKYQALCVEAAPPKESEESDEARFAEQDSETPINALKVHTPALAHAAWCRRRVSACIHVHVEPTARALVAGSSTASPRGCVAACHPYRCRELDHHTGLHVQGAAHVAGRDSRGLLRGGQRTDRGADPRSTHAHTQHHNTQHPPAQHTHTHTGTHMAGASAPGHFAS